MLFLFYNIKLLWYLGFDSGEDSSINYYFSYFYNCYWFFNIICFRFNLKSNFYFGNDVAVFIKCRSDDRVWGLLKELNFELY